MQIFDDRFQVESGWNCSSILTLSYTTNILHEIWIKVKEYVAQSIPFEIGVGILTHQINAVTLYNFG
jgi:hypothetical protein